VQDLVLPVDQCAAAVESVLRHGTASVPAELKESVLQLLLQVVSPVPLDNWLRHYLQQWPKSSSMHICTTSYTHRHAAAL
jgi:hypothetical protein